jgi:hypothetical protein
MSKVIPLFVRIPEGLNEQLERHAEELGESKASCVRSALRSYFCDGNGIHPRLVELASSYLLDYITAEEMAREVAALVLAAPAVDERQMRLEIPAPTPA